MNSVAGEKSFDATASWNFRHMVNLHRIRQYDAVNRRMGYGPLEIADPEVEDAGAAGRGFTGWLCLSHDCFQPGMQLVGSA